MVHILWWKLHRQVCGHPTQQCLHKCKGLAHCSRRGRSPPRLRCPRRETSDHITPPFAARPPQILPGGLPLLVPAICLALLVLQRRRLLCPFAAQTLVEVLPVAHPQPSSWLLPVPACRAARASPGGPAPQHLCAAVDSRAQDSFGSSGLPHTRAQDCQESRHDQRIPSTKRCLRGCSVLSVSHPMLCTSRSGSFCRLTGGCCRLSAMLCHLLKLILRQMSSATSVTFADKKG
jgi:hypothetical protein